jgi:hypothetical protein
MWWPWSTHPPYPKTCHRPNCSCFCDSKALMIREHRGSRWKCDKSNRRGIEKWIPRMLPKPLQMSAKVWHCKRELLWRKYCVNRCTVIYLWVMDQFREFFEATCYVFKPTVKIVLTINSPYDMSICIFKALQNCVNWFTDYSNMIFLLILCTILICWRFIQLNTKMYIGESVNQVWPPLWSSSQSSWLQIQWSGFDSRRYQIFWVVAVLERGLLSLVSTTEELLGRNSSSSGLENREYGCRDLLHWPRDTLYAQKLALTLPTSSSHSVGIVRWQTKATEFSLVNQVSLLPIKYTTFTSPYSTASCWEMQGAMGRQYRPSFHLRTLDRRQNHIYNKQNYDYISLRCKKVKVKLSP